MPQQTMTPLKAEAERMLRDLHRTNSEFPVETLTTLISARDELAEVKAKREMMLTAQALTIDQLRDQLAKTEEQRKNCVYRIDFDDNKMAQLEQELATLRAENERLSQEVIKANGFILKADQEDERLRKENEALKSDLAISEERIALACGKAEKVKTDNNALMAVAKVIVRVRYLCGLRSEPYIPPSVRAEIELLMDDALTAAREAGVEI